MFGKSPTEIYTRVKRGGEDMDEIKYLPEVVHTEFAKRVEEENNRQNARISALERTMQDINKIALSVEKLTTQIEVMTKTLEKQGTRLEKIESKPEKRWETLIGGIITGVIGILIGMMSAGLIK